MAHILLIDDHENLREVLGIFLKEQGHTIIEACDGHQAIQCYKDGKFDLVITDMLMPNKDGVETIAELRRINAGVHVIAISGGGRLVSPEFCLELAKSLGIKQVLKKPFSLHQLEHCDGTHFFEPPEELVRAMS